MLVASCAYEGIVDAPQADSTGYFLHSYDDARLRFRATAERLASGHAGAEIDHLAVASATDDDLTIDYVYLPATRSPKKLVIFTSGVHGAEAFVGSGVQEMLMTTWLPSLDFSETSVLVIHSLNPWGYRHGRRVTEHNVDLNRNLSIEPALFQTANDAYRELDEFLNPKHAVSGFDVNTDVYELYSEVASLGETKLRDATLMGQYEFDAGIYFGGREPEPQKQALEELLLRVIDQHEAVFLMDLHTGYGERGRMHFFGDVGIDGAAAMQTVFAGYQIDSAATNPDFYETKGDLIVYVGQLAAAKTYLGTTLEYGTLDSQTLEGGMRSLLRMRLENQGVHFGYESDIVRSAVQRRFGELFNPQDNVWRRQILDATSRAVPDLVARFQAL